MVAAGGTTHKHHVCKTMHKHLQPVQKDFPKDFRMPQLFKRMGICLTVVTILEILTLVVMALHMIIPGLYLTILI